jgi:hypothetical protein
VALRGVVLAATFGGLGLGCKPDCMVDGYARVASGSMEYTLSNHDVDGVMPASFVMQRFDAFRDGECSDDDDRFTLSLGPDCLLHAYLAYRWPAVGESGFTYAEGVIFRGVACGLALDEGRRVSGRVESGSITFDPSISRIVLALAVDRTDGVPTASYLRVTLEASWH